MFYAKNGLLLKYENEKESYPSFAEAVLAAKLLNEETKEAPITPKYVTNQNIYGIIDSWAEQNMITTTFVPYTYGSMDDLTNMK